MDGVHFKTVESYKMLKGMSFRGHFVGRKKNPNYGTFRSVFEVDMEHQHNDEIVDLFSDIREKIHLCKSRMWRGFSDQQDYSHDLGWQLWLWAPKSCALDDSVKDKELKLTISRVEFFEFKPTFKHKYEVGVNIFVQPSYLHEDTSDDTNTDGAESDHTTSLLEEYQELVGMCFYGDYVDDKWTEDMGEDVPSTVYELDTEDEYNRPLCEQFAAIRKALEESDEVAHKSFTDMGDWHEVPEGKLWIWADNHHDIGDDCMMDLIDESEQKTYRITRVEIWGGIAHIEVQRIGFAPISAIKDPFAAYMSSLGK